jgi:ribosome-binding factor A
MLARIFERAPLRDPDLQGVTITVTEVRMSPDLRHALCFVLPLGGGDAAKLVTALTRAAPYLRSRLAEEMRLRTMPTVAFASDESFERAAAVDRLLHRPEVARDLIPAAAASDDKGGEDAPDEDGDGA